MKKLIVFLVMVFLMGCTTYHDQLVENTTTIDGTVVVISGFRFNPETIVVNQGDTITWKNIDKDEHTLLYEGRESDPLGEDETFTVTIENQGTYEYTSGNHPFMKGKIIVRGNDD